LSERNFNFMTVYLLHILNLIHLFYIKFSLDPSDNIFVLPKNKCRY